MTSYIIPESIASEEVFGDYLDSHESSILSEEVFGIPRVIQDSFILVFSSIKSEEVFGGDYFECWGSGILAEEAFGIPTIILAPPQALVTNITSIPSEEAFGIPTITTSSTQCIVESIPTQEQFGVPWIVNHGVVSREIIRVAGRNYKFIVFRRRK